MSAYSIELRERITEAVDQGASKSSVARRFKVARSTVIDYVKRQKAGQLAAEKHPGPKSWLDDEGRKVLEKQVEAHNDWTLEQHAEGLFESIGLKVKKSAIGKYFKQLKITRKKKLYSKRTR